MSGAGERQAPVRVGIAGYGTGGRNFHAPFAEAANGVELVGVVTRREDRRQRLAQQFPGVPAYDSIGHMVTSARANGGLNAVTITTPPETHPDLVLEALKLGVHVIVDKPFAPDGATARALRDAASDAGLLLGVYHNRRWDSDIRTVAAVLGSGELGDIRRFHSRFDLDDPDTLEGGATGGLLRDIGSHLVDQALWLFGPAERVLARLDWTDLESGRTDSGFVLTILHASGVDSHLSSSKLNRLQERDLRLYGSNGSYVARGTDVQARLVFAGERPVNSRATWGFEPESSWGVLRTSHGCSTVPACQGDYTAYYEAFASAVRDGSDPPVSASEGVAVLDVLDAARRSAGTGVSELIREP